MGVMARKQGDSFVITSDRVTDDLPSKVAPKRKVGDVFRVWTGRNWSSVLTDAEAFKTMDEADEYVKSNSSRLMESG